MKIIYADDDRLSLDIVQRALQARGHEVRTIYTGDATNLEKALQDSLETAKATAYVILDGHNLTLDAHGRPVADIGPRVLMSWFQQYGLNSQARFILYSSDDKLIQQTQTDLSAGFWAAISKVGEHGGLIALLHLFETS